MAWLELETSGQYHVAFRFGSRKFKRSLKTSNRRTAESRCTRLEENIQLVESGRLVIPLGANIPAFLMSDGKLNANVEIPRYWTLGELCIDYFENLPNGSLEPNSVYTARIHVQHIHRILGSKFHVQGLSNADLQQYVERRSKEKGRRGRLVSTATIKKELSTLSSIWTWARRMKHVHGTFPNEGLRFPIVQEKPPFQTWQEIERQIARGGLSEVEIAELWDCLFLTLAEIDQVLQFVRDNSRQRFLFPMFVMAAHTGARRSELIRSRIDDFNFAAGCVHVRERKRVKGKKTLRQVPLSPMLCRTFKDWFDNHPGGVYTFCYADRPTRSRKSKSESAPLTVDEASDQFRSVLKGSKWDVIRGWHVFRHSFASNCALKRIDQRMINAWMGHQTEEMMKRYQHRFPDSQASAIKSVFG